MLSSTSTALLSLAGIAVSVAAYSALPPQFSKLLIKTKFLLTAYATEVLSSSFSSRLQIPSPGDEFISPIWITQILRDNGVLNEKNRVEKVIIEDLEGNRGLSGALSRLRLTYAKEEDLDSSLPKTLILKMSPAGISKRYNTIAAGQYREAVFYDRLGTQFSQFLPKVYFTYGSSTTGTYIIVMEDLSQYDECVGVNQLFGNQIWGVSSPLANSQDPVNVLREMFMFAAETHAKYWNDRSLLEHKWLKATEWYRGRDRARWELAIDSGRASWGKCKLTIADGSSGVKWTQKLIDIIDRSYALTSWDNLQKHLKDRNIPFTLCHGDFHASNMIWLHTESENHLRVVDWSEVGVWEPTADLGQTIISDVKPEIWRENGTDIRLLREYWDKLISLGVSAEEYTFDMCLERYEQAPVERWIWVFSIMSAFGLPAAAVQYFHDQILAFIEAHGDHEAYVLKPVVCLISGLAQT